MLDSETFFRLTPERVLQAVEAGGFRPTGHCTTLNALENRVFDIRLEDDRHLVAKFYRPGRWDRECILEEHRLLEALQEGEIPVCAPLRFPDGETLHEMEGIHYAVWPRQGGRAPDELDDDQVQVLGRLLARIHNAAERVRVQRRPTLDSALPRTALALLEDGDFLPPSCRSRYRSAVEALVSLYDEWSRDTALHAIHGDCHLGNLLRGDAGWLFLDFDDMMIGPAVHDVWMLLPGRDAEAARQRALLVGAYRAFRPFEERSLRLIEPLRGFRFVWYAGWIAKRWRDPAFPDAFPHFGSADYWENETRDLEQQLELIESSGTGPSPAGPGARREDAPELSNKDFFWDLD